MITVESKVISKNFGGYRETALVEPVEVSYYGKPSVVVVSYREYTRLKNLDRQVRTTADMTDREADLLASTRMSSDHDHLNSELA